MSGNKWNIRVLASEKEEMEWRMCVFCCSRECVTGLL